MFYYPQPNAFWLVCAKFKIEWMCCNLYK